MPLSLCVCQIGSSVVTIDNEGRCATRQNAFAYPSSLLTDSGQI